MENVLKQKINNMKNLFCSITFMFISFISYSQVNLSGINIGAGGVIESKVNFLDGGYFELGYSKINMSKPGIFYGHGTEFLGKLRFQNSISGDLVGINGGIKYHFLASLLSIGVDAEYLQSITSNGGEFNLVPNFQINMFTPELSVTFSYALNLTSAVYTNDHGRFSLGLRYIVALNKNNRILGHKKID